MIRIICTQCRTTLTIDDAFAGGVCRCQHCGTIQTVPSRSRQAAGAGQTAKKAPAPPAEPKQFRKRTGDGGVGSGTGLDELANVDASSGLTSSRLRNHPAEKPAPRKPGRAKPAGTAAPPAPPAQTKRPALLIAAAVAVIAVLVGVIVYLVLNWNPATTTPGSSASPGGTQTPAGGGTAAVPGGPAAALETPSFAGIPLDEPSVIYVLDRGDATRPTFGELKEATLRSVESLGSGRKFQVIFWKTDAEEAYPPGGLAFAMKGTVDTCRKRLAEVFAFGHADVGPAIKAATAQKPTAIVLATGNDLLLDDDFIRTVLDAQKGSGTKIHTVGIRAGAPGATWTALKTIAQRTGGEFREVSPAELR